MGDRDAPIGIFDSGLGGLTVVRAIRAALPQEVLVYLGDTARVPYGTRSSQTVLRYARTCGQHLQRHGIKLLVVACNTVSAVALGMLRVELDVPVVGVIVPGAGAGVRTLGTGGRLGVIATTGTVRSGAYVRAAAAESSRVEVVQQAAPLLVPLAEEGWLEGDVPERVVERYLTPLAHAEIGALVLGCTHYPLLRGAIEATSARLCGGPLPIVDSAEATATHVAELLDARSLLTSGSEGGLMISVTDRPERFAEVAGRFLGETVVGLRVEQVDL